ncbi:hypothetical protein NL676_027406 [Syzygium grande]|nr:hypothetical protein NL676_027406 [Syzygium grande]
MSDLDRFTKTVYSCSVTVGFMGRAHKRDLLAGGAGVASGIGLDFGDLSRSPLDCCGYLMLEYKIDPGELTVGNIQSQSHHRSRLDLHGGSMQGGRGGVCGWSGCED